jgi:hypothetical protein
MKIKLVKGIQAAKCRMASGSFLILICMAKVGLIILVGKVGLNKYLA